MGFNWADHSQNLEIGGVALFVVKTSFYFSTTMDCVFLKNLKYKNKK